MLKRSILFGLSILAVAACGNIAPVDPGSHVPKVHRPTAMICDSTRPPISPGMSDGGLVTDAGFPQPQCTVDADCTMGTNGRCAYSRVGKTCSYDTCTTDSDCGSGGVCMCRTSATDVSPNHCVGSSQPGACRVDGDCSPKGYCSPSLGSCGTYSGIQGWYCHTANDTCVDDEDCKGDGGLNGYCMFEPTAKKWQCSYSICAG